jgi:hypothetical protein
VVVGVLTMASQEEAVLHQRVHRAYRGREEPAMMVKWQASKLTFQGMCSEGEAKGSKLDYCKKPTEIFQATMYAETLLGFPFQSRGKT